MGRSLAKVEFSSGAYIFKEGDVADDFYVLVLGEVSVISDGDPINTLAGLASFGELALFREVRSSIRYRYVGCACARTFAAGCAPMRALCARSALPRRTA